MSFTPRSIEGLPAHVSDAVVHSLQAADLGNREHPQTVDRVPHLGGFVLSLEAKWDADQTRDGVGSQKFDVVFRGAAGGVALRDASGLAEIHPMDIMRTRYTDDAHYFTPDLPTFLGRILAIDPRANRVLNDGSVPAAYKFADTIIEQFDGSGSSQDGQRTDENDPFKDLFTNFGDNIADMSWYTPTPSGFVRVKLSAIPNFELIDALTKNDSVKVMITCRQWLRDLASYSKEIDAGRTARARKLDELIKAKSNKSRT